MIWVQGGGKVDGGTVGIKIGDELSKIVCVNTHGRTRLTIQDGMVVGNKILRNVRGRQEEREKEREQRKINEKVGRVDQPEKKERIRSG